MIKKIRERLDGAEDGFTLIELLVVVIIIGILAAIAIPTFLSQRERGWEAAAQSDLRNAVLAMESCATTQGGVYNTAAGTDCSTEAALTDNGFRPTDGVTVAVTAAVDATTFTATADHASLPEDGDVFTYDSATGQITGPA